MKIETIDENGTYQTIEAVQADRITFGHHEPGKARLALVSEGRGIYLFVDAPSLTTICKELTAAIEGGNDVRSH